MNADDIRKQFRFWYSAEGRGGYQTIYHPTHGYVGYVWRVSGGPWDSSDDEWALTRTPPKTQTMGWPDIDQDYLSFKTRKAALSHLAHHILTND